MGHSDSETEFKKKHKKHKDHSDSDSEDDRKEKREERKERRDREKEERKAKVDREKEERKARMDRDKEERDREKEERKAKMDWEKEERKARMDTDKEERKAKMDREKEERKERKEKEREERDREREERKKHKEDKYGHGDKHEGKPSYPSEPGFSSSSGFVGVHDGKSADYYNPSSGGLPEPPKPHSQPTHTSQSGETPWFLREPDADPLPNHPPLRPDFPVPSPPQYSIHPPPQQLVQAGGVPSIQNAPPSGYRIPLDPNAQFPSPDRVGPSPATDSDGSTPVFIGSAIFANSVHPCKIVPSLNPPCRVLYDRNEVEHHGRYDLLPVTQDMEWIPSKNGEIPPGRRPVEGGYESNGSKLYHALGVIQGVYVPGKTGQHVGGASVPFEGREHILQDHYSILCWK